MSVCKPIYPIGTLKKNNLPVIPDFNDLARAFDDPTLRFDMKKVKTLNTLNNALLLSTSLNDYPALKERFEANAITDEEYADFLFDSGNVPETIQDLFLDDFPTQVDFDELSNLLEPDPANAADSGTGENGIEEYWYALRDNKFAVPTSSPLDWVRFIPSIGPNDTLVGTINGNQVFFSPSDIGFWNTTTNFSAGTIVRYDGIIDSPVINTGGVTNEDIALTPIDRFVPGVGYEDITDWSPGPNLQDYLSQLDFYYSTNYSAIIGSGICESFTNPFAKVSSLIAMAAGLTGGIESLADKIKSIVSSLANFSLGSLISGLASKLQGIIDGVINSVLSKQANMLSKVNALKSSVASQFQGQGAGGQRLFEFFNKKLQQVSVFLSDINVNSLNSKIKNVFEMNKSQFQDLNSTVMNLLALKGCGISSSIDFSLEAPVNEVKGLIDRTTLTKSTQEAKSLIVTNQCLEAGAIRVNPNTRRVQSGGPQGHASTANRANGGGNVTQSGPVGSGASIQPTEYVTIPMTDAERSYVQSITKEGTDEFIFSESIKQMGTVCKNTYKAAPAKAVAANHTVQWDPNQNYPDAGWKYIVEKNPFIFAALKRVSERLKEDVLLSEPLLLNSAYRSPYYNRIVLREIRNNKGAAWNSKHMAAMAIDISTNNLTNFGTATLIKYCSQEGFNRISVYNNFVHVDIADGCGRGDWTKNYRSDSNILRAMQLHLTRQHTEGARR